MSKVRFWVWHADGQVRVTLRDGQSLEFHHVYDHEEGYHAESTRLTYDAAAGEVLQEWSSEGRDCDGRLDRSGECFCRVADLAVREFEGVRFPEWQALDSRQRDYTAEAAGY